MRLETRCVEFCFTPSYRVRLAVATLHGLAALVVIAGPFPVWALALLLLVAISSWKNWRAAAGPVQLRYSGNEWFLIEPPKVAGADPEPLSWLPSTRIGPHLSLLHAKSGGRRHFWPVASDSLSADEFRRLRVWVGLAHRTDERSARD